MTGPKLGRVTEPPRSEGRLDEMFKISEESTLQGRTIRKTALETQREPSTATRLRAVIEACMAFLLMMSFSYQESVDGPTFLYTLERLNADKG
jgi:hypothetical protein